VHPVLILQLLVLVVVANGPPILANKFLGDALGRPLDGGAVFRDGRPIFGPSKTIRGIVLSLLATPLAAMLLGLGWKVGALVAIGAMAGDLLSSFAKRRLGLPSSSMAIGLDQIPESLFPLMACRLLLPVSLLDIVAGVTIFVAGALVLSRILFRLGFRDQPY
jgi:CDP-diglyceride synthetase